jgi:hypothetical protein
MNDEDLRDLFAGLAMQGLIHHFDFDRFKQDPQRVARWAYDAADAMIEAKYAEYAEPEEGITAIKPKRKRSMNVSSTNS